MANTDRPRADADKNPAPGHAGDPRKRGASNAGNDEVDIPPDTPQVETDQLYDLMPDENGEADGRPIPTGV